MNLMERHILAQTKLNEVQTTDLGEVIAILTEVGLIPTDVKRNYDICQTYNECKNPIAQFKLIQTSEKHNLSYGRILSIIYLKKEKRKRYNLIQETLFNE